MRNRRLYREKEGVDGERRVLGVVQEGESVVCFSPEFGASPVMWRQSDVLERYEAVAEEGRESWEQCRQHSTERVVVVEGSYLSVLNLLRDAQPFGYVPHLCRVLVNGAEVGRGLRITEEMNYALQRCEAPKHTEGVNSKRVCDDRWSVCWR